MKVVAPLARALLAAAAAAAAVQMQGADALKQNALVPVAARSSVVASPRLEATTKREGSFCVKATTTGRWPAPGDLKVWVTAGGVETVVFDDWGTWGIVFEVCYADPVTQLRVQSSANAWGGPIEVSADGGTTYEKMWCTGCNNGRDTTYVVASGGSASNFGTESSYRTDCTNAKTCIIVPAYCLRITTGTESYNNGFVKVTVTVGPSTTVEADGSSSFALGEAVISKCYPAPPHVALQNENTDAWVGTVEVSTNGGKTYAAMECHNCDPATGTIAATVAVDGDGNSAQMGMLACQNGKSCALYTPGFPDAPTVQPSAAVAVTGDPHVSNMRGRRFDIRHAGMAMLLQIPRGATADATLLRLDGHTKNEGGLCDQRLYLDAVNITGKWAERGKEGYYRIKANKNAVSPSHPHHKHRFTFEGVFLVFSHAMTRTGVTYLNIRVSNLSKLGMPVGGLLGEDDVSWAAALPAACKEGHYTSRMISVLSASDAGPSPTL